MLFRKSSCFSHCVLPSVTLWRRGGGPLLPSADVVTSMPRSSATFLTPQEVPSMTSPSDVVREGMEKTDEEIGPPTGHAAATTRGTTPSFSPVHSLLQEQEDPLTHPPPPHRTPAKNTHASSCFQNVSPISPSPMTDESTIVPVSPPRREGISTDHHHHHSLSSIPSSASLPSAEVPLPSSRSVFLATHIQEALRQQLCHPVRPLPVKGVYLQLCHSYRVMAELYHSSTSRRLSKLRGALRFLRRHNVLLHSLLFYVPRGTEEAFRMQASSLERNRRLASSFSSSTMNTTSISSSSFASSDVSCWNVTSEFTRLRLFGEAFLHAELRTRLWKLLPDLPTEVFVEILQRCTSEESYAMLFDQLALGALVGARPPKPLRLKTKLRTPRSIRRKDEDLSPHDVHHAKEGEEGMRMKKKKNTKDRCPIPNRPTMEAEPLEKPQRKPKRNPDAFPLPDEGRPSAEARAQLQRERVWYRQQNAFTPHQKGSMVCALVGELRWFGSRTRATHRTHNNAIFPPSDVLILHVLATHVVECVPAEMLFSLVQPSLEEVKQRWVNFSTSLPCQLEKRFTPSRSRYRLSWTPCERPTTTTTTKGKEPWMKKEKESVRTQKDASPLLVDGSQASPTKVSTTHPFTEDVSGGVLSTHSEHSARVKVEVPPSPSVESAGDAGKGLQEEEVAEAPPFHTHFPLSGSCSTFPVPTLSALPLSPTTTAIQSVIRPTVRIRGIKGGVGSAHYRLFIRDVKELSHDTQFSLTSGPFSFLSSSPSTLSSPKDTLDCPTNESQEKGAVMAQGGMSNERRREILAGLSV